MKKIILFSPFLILGVLLVGFGSWNILKSKEIKSTEVPDIIETIKISDDQISDLKMYNTQDGFLSFYYPANLEKMVYGKQFSLSIGSKQDILDEYDKFKDGGCPSTCGRLIADPILFQKQFDILNKLNSLSNCNLTLSDKQEINDNFILFSGGISGKYSISGISTDLGECGLKIIQSDGFDVSLSHIYYNVSFFVNEEIINISLPLYPHGVFADVDVLWKKLGYDSISNVCDSSCLKKESEYYNKFNVDHDTEKEVIKTYDQIIKSLKFINKFQQG